MLLRKIEILFKINFIHKIGLSHIPDYIFTGTSLAFDLYSNGWKRYYKLSDIWKEHHSGLHNYHGYLLKNSNLDVYVRNGLANSLLLFDKDKGREV